MKYSLYDLRPRPGTQYPLGKKATLLVVHPGNDNLYISLRCELAAISRDGALEHLDLLTRRNMNARHWYGDVEAKDSPAKDPAVELPCSIFRFEILPPVRQRYRALF